MNDSTPDTSMQHVLAVVGPTAVGKTALAEDLALVRGGEVISADAMQVYRGMDIGTAKPGPSERRVPYHCIDCVNPGEPYSAALYQRDARAAIEQCAARQALPVICGGTGLYVRAALDAFEFPPGEQLDNPSRAHYEALAASSSPASLHSLLASRDPDSAALIHPNNVRRVVRALELADQGTSYALQASGFSTRKSLYAASFLGLTMEREALYARIDARIDAMVEKGLIAEVERLLQAGFREALTASQAIGYKEFVPVVEGLADVEEAISQVKTATRRYAKRQLTWFRADDRVRWVDVSDLSPPDRLAAAEEALR